MTDWFSKATLDVHMALREHTQRSGSVLTLWANYRTLRSYPGAASADLSLHGHCGDQLEESEPNGPRQSA